MKGKQTPLFHRLLFPKNGAFRKGNLRTDEALGAGAFNAAISQATDSTPLYGREVWPAYPERFGSAVGDIVSQNFFGDFFLATAFQEDTRYIRRGPAPKVWPRIAYAISRSVVTRTDSGGAMFNWSNVLIGENLTGLIRHHTSSHPISGGHPSHL